MSNGNSIVWILGAGFSKPLGAPMLGELLTQRSWERVMTIYDRTYPFLRGERGREVPPFYEAGRQKEDYVGEWEHAEEFLERIDLALVKDSTRDLLLGYLGDAFEGADALARFRFDALRLLAAEICMFQKDLDADLERMAPYVAWARMLEPKDVVLTFNYDSVPDLVAHSKKKNGLWIPTPSELSSRPPNSTPVLKLHGSVDWKRNGSQVLRGGSEFALTSTSVDELAIATPGPTKQRMIKEGGPFAQLWEMAKEALLRATAVVFVGYRMPPTDAATKQWLIDQLRANIERRKGIPKDDFDDPPTKMLPVHTVLGPGLDKPDPKRLKGLLLNVDGFIQLKQWDMGTEDFLGLVGRSELLDPHPPYTTAAAEARRAN